MSSFFSVNKEIFEKMRKSLVHSVTCNLLPEFTVAIYDFSIDLQGDNK